MISKKKESVMTACARVAGSSFVATELQLNRYFLVDFYNDV